MTQNLVYNLLNLALSKDISTCKIGELQKSMVACKSQWQPVLMELNLNGVTPLVARTLEEYHLSDRLPASDWQKMQFAHRHVRMLNTFLFLTVSQIIQALRAANLHPVAGANITLADRFYQDPGDRWLECIDIILSLEEIAPAKEVFKSLGFTLTGTSLDRVYFTNPLGIICQLQVSRNPDLLSLTQEIQPQHIQLSSLTVLEPNAMLVELMAQKSDRHSSNISLQSILDIALLLQKCGDLLEPHRLQILMSQKDDWGRLGRIVRCIETKLEQKVPQWLSEIARTANRQQAIEPRKLPRFLSVNSQLNRQNRLALEVNDLVIKVRK
jgi:hypothetical protein